MSWNKGNELLIAIANQLREHFPKAKIFRFEGDDFLVVSEEKTIFASYLLNIKENDPEAIITIDSDYFVIENPEDIHKLDAYMPS
jgi:GGDEF domain-containing protein